MRHILMLILAGGAASPQILVNGGRTIHGPVNYCSDTGSTPAYSCSFSPAIPAYAAGAVYHFRANTANTGPATVNFNGLGAMSIRKHGDVELAAGDIAAGQLLTVIFDGTRMQLLSHPGPAAGGGGGSPPTLITTPGQGYWSPFGEEAGTYFYPNAVDRDVRVWQVVLPFRATLGKVAVNLFTGSGTACPGGTCALLAGLYDAACGSLLAWGRATSGGSPDINSPGAKSIPLSTLVTLEPGVYHLAVSTDSPSLAMFAKDVSPTFVQAANASATRFGGAANKSTGNGSTLAFPAACGTVSATGYAPPMINLWER